MEFRFRASVSCVCVTAPPGVFEPVPYRVVGRRFFLAHCGAPNRFRETTPRAAHTLWGCHPPNRTLGTGGRAPRARVRLAVDVMADIDCRFTPKDVEELFKRDKNLPQERQKPISRMMLLHAYQVSHGPKAIMRGLKAGIIQKDQAVASALEFYRKLTGDEHTLDWLLSNEMVIVAKTRQKLDKVDPSTAKDAAPLGLKWQEVAPFGTKWKRAGREAPGFGNEIVNDLLTRRLFAKHTFTVEELESFGVQGLEQDSYIAVGQDYFQQAASGEFSSGEEIVDDKLARALRNRQEFSLAELNKMNLPELHWYSFINVDGTIFVPAPSIQTPIAMKKWMSERPSCVHNDCEVLCNYGKGGPAGGRWNPRPKTILNASPPPPGSLAAAAANKGTPSGAFSSKSPAAGAPLLAKTPYSGYNGVFDVKAEKLNRTPAPHHYDTTFLNMTSAANLDRSRPSIPFSSRCPRKSAIEPFDVNEGPRKPAIGLVSKNPRRKLTRESMERLGMIEPLATDSVASSDFVRSRRVPSGVSDAERQALSDERAGFLQDELETSQFLGWMWQDVGPERPRQGPELFNSALVDHLQLGLRFSWYDYWTMAGIETVKNRADGKDMLVVGGTVLTEDSFIKVREHYFKPIGVQSVVNERLPDGSIIVRTKLPAHVRHPRPVQRTWLPKEPPLRPPFVSSSENPFDPYLLKQALKNGPFRGGWRLIDLFRLWDIDETYTLGARRRASLTTPTLNLEEFKEAMRAPIVLKNWLGFPLASDEDLEKTFEYLDPDLTGDIDLPELNMVLRRCPNERPSPEEYQEQLRLYEEKLMAFEAEVSSADLRMCPWYLLPVKDVSEVIQPGGKGLGTGEKLRSPPKGKARAASSPRSSQRSSAQQSPRSSSPPPDAWGDSKEYTKGINSDASTGWRSTGPPRGSPLKRTMTLGFMSTGLRARAATPPARSLRRSPSPSPPAQTEHDTEVVAPPAEIALPLSPAEIALPPSPLLPAPALAKIVPAVSPMASAPALQQQKTGEGLITTTKDGWHYAHSPGETFTPSNGTPRSQTASQAAESPIGMIRQLKELLDEGLITPAQFEIKRAELLARV